MGPNQPVDLDPGEPLLQRQVAFSAWVGAGVDSQHALAEEQEEQDSAVVAELQPLMDFDFLGYAVQGMLQQMHEQPIEESKFGRRYMGGG
eukprot:CAMPEP_0173392590 /NCGR_PEP_ID=MMETSP1356-20130122/20233_1 /TAXON_ID=77927 ORGANISM="Hemiselmis virescens, Strain PCC157" /NCGR_SAMPLE_ID=MMETSP1356 /ASSEMBLY_ACC=CAM_ASM_000847 /LENGTH=89 /DNA_ID=CAMNT_0014350427 /DNA_START=21 /DNA_END=287 /DNA_ORIENTATION=-